MILSLFLIVTSSSFSQRPGVFISKNGFFQRLIFEKIFLPEEIRTRLIYGVPQWIYPSYRRNLERQILTAQLQPIYALPDPIHPAEAEIVEAFGIPEELRDSPVEILRLEPPVQELVSFASATSNPDLSSFLLRPSMRDLAILGLGAQGNLHLEAAGTMREQNYEQRLVHQELERAYQIMTAQINQLLLALNAGEDVSAILQMVIEERDSLGYIPASKTHRFWNGFRW